MEKKPNKPAKGIATLMNTIKNTMGDIYQNTHMTSLMNSRDLDGIKNRMDKAINGISIRNKDNTGSNSLSTLLAKNNIKTQINGSEGGKVVKGVEDLFNDSNSIESIALLLEQNKSIRDFDQEIDIILKYHTILNETLELKKDAVLAADNNTKDYLNFTPLNVEKDNSFDSNIKKLKEKYKLIETVDNIYDNIAKYGEEFYYIVDYKKAFSRLLSNKNGTANMTFANESSVYADQEECCIIESSLNDIYITENNLHKSDNTGINEDFADLKVELYTGGLLENAINEATTINKTNVKLDKILNRSKLEDSFTTDGLEAPDGIIDTKKIDDKAIKVNGSVFKRLKRENIIPIYIDDTPLGYYYIECDFNKFTSSTNSVLNPMLTRKTYNKNIEDVEKEKQKEEMLNKISRTLSKYIDTNFINNNQDMADQIYMILNHNNINNSKLSKLKVTYLPPEDVEHLYFKLDPETHRGISDMQKALIPAKLYICLYITNALAILTRGFDKRAYYVKQSVDTNIAQSLINVINQIKKGNFGAREISSIKNILGSTGKFQDLIIPTNSSGEAPIQMEVMQGQDINTQEEFMNRLEQMGVEALDFSYEYVQSRNNIDYALRLTMSNGKILRKTFKRQTIVEMFASRIATKLYNNEFNTNEQLQLQLPPPTFLVISNNNQLIQQVSETVNQIVNIECGQDEDPLLVQLFTKKLMKHYLSTYIDSQNIDRIKTEATNEYAREKEKRRDE